MKTSIGKHLVCTVLALVLSGAALAETEADVVKSMSANPKIKLVHKLAAFEGMLLGFDGGEWGGAIIFLDGRGRATEVYSGNINGIVAVGGRVLAFSGLAHLGDNSGKIIELTRMAKRPPATRELVDLQGEPSDVHQVDEQTVSFRVYTDLDGKGKMYSACKAFAKGRVSNWNDCTGAAAQR